VQTHAKGLIITEHHNSRTKPKKIKENLITMTSVRGAAVGDDESERKTTGLSKCSSFTMFAPAKMQREVADKRTDRTFFSSIE
jgi:hypothetical protein